MVGLERNCKIGAEGDRGGELEGKRSGELEGSCRVGEGGKNRCDGGMDPSRYGYVSHFEPFEQGVLIVQSSTCYSRKTKDNTSRG